MVLKKNCNEYSWNRFRDRRNGEWLGLFKQRKVNHFLTLKEENGRGFFSWWPRALWQVANSLGGLFPVQAEDSVWFNEINLMRL